MVKLPDSRVERQVSEALELASQAFHQGRTRRLGNVPAGANLLTL